MAKNKAKYKRPKAKCSRCNNLGPVAVRKANGGTICMPCYQRQRDQKECCVCHEAVITKRRTRQGEPICIDCSEESRRRKPCSLCSGIIDRVEDYNPDTDEPVCHACYQREIWQPKLPKSGEIGRCVQCKQDKKIAARGQCWPCYNSKYRAKYERPKRKCSRCNRRGPVAKYNFKKQPVCMSCYQEALRRKRGARKRKKHLRLAS